MNSDFIELLKLFNANEVKYLIVGGVAFIFHAEPRYTKDLDIWVKPDKENAAAIYKSLREFGAPLAGVAEEDLPIASCSTRWDGPWSGRYFDVDYRHGFRRCLDASR